MLLVKKTKYISTHNDPQNEPIWLNDEVKIDAVKQNIGYNWLGFWLTHNNDLSTLIAFNIKKKMFTIRKFYEWLTDNEETPFTIKIKVLYSCLFSSIIYSCETWGDPAMLSDNLRKIERKLLKRILGVKDGTTDNIVLFECNRPGIISVIKDRQYMFFKKLSELRNEDTTLKGVLELYNALIEQNNSGILTYYNSLRDNHRTVSAEEIKNSLQTSDATMCRRYVSLTNLEQSTNLYNSFANDKDRIIITRWRLSSHKLFVETGRYKRPKIVTDERKCKLCKVLEDEEHALFSCSAHQFIRTRYKDILQLYPNVNKLLNPQTRECIKSVSKYICDIEDNMKKLDMFH